MAVISRRWKQRSTPCLLTCGTLRPLLKWWTSRSRRRRSMSVQPALLTACRSRRCEAAVCRNLESSGYFIPLLDRGSSATFWPDLLVWIDRTVVAIDTKGKHLLSEDFRRKLFEIDGTGDRSRIILRMISEGQWNISAAGQVGKHGSAGYTVWSWANGRLKAALCPDAKEAVEPRLPCEERNERPTRGLLQEWSAP